MKKEYHNATALTGKDTRLSRKERKRIAGLVSRELSMHPDRMRTLPIGSVFRSITEGNAAIVFAAKGTKNGKKRTNEVAAFAHVIPGRDEFGMAEEGVLEVGAVLTLAEPGNGYAKSAVIEAVKTAKRQGAEKVRALVHVDNDAANGLMSKLAPAGEPIRTRPSNYVKDEEGKPAEMNEYILWETKTA